MKLREESFFSLSLRRERGKKKTMKAGGALQGYWCLSGITNWFPRSVLGCLYSLYHKLETRPHLTEPKNGPFVAVFFP